MTIETSPAPQSASKAGSAADARGSKSATKAGAAGAPATGFMAVLAALDDQGSAPAAPTAADDGKNMALAPVDIAQTAIDLIANGVPQTHAMAAVPTLDAGTAGQVAANSLPAGVAPAMAGALQTAEAARPGGLRAGAGVAPAGQEMDSALGAAKDSGVASGGSKAKAASNTAAQMGDAKTSLVPADASKVQDVKFMAALEAMKALQGGSESVATAVATSTVNPASLSERSTSERLQLREQDTGGHYAPQFSAMGATSYASSSAQEVGALSSEMYVAQQVSYWISQDVQNAELTLDGLGNSPVEVSISMSGNEAHIMFRSDEAQTLSVLDGATAHLKEMLQEQGLVLSGVSVGTSGSGDAGDGERRQRQGARQQSATVPVVAAEAQRMPAGSAGRTLDLFV